MAKVEVGQRVRVKSDIDSDYAGQVAVVESFHGDSAIVTVEDGSRLMYLLDELEGLEAIAVTFQPGDIVRAEKGDEIIQGEVFIDAGDQTLYIDISFWAYVFTLDDLETSGYTLTLVKRPEPEIVLPTKPGMYFATEIMRDKTKHHTDGKIFFYLNSDGEWVDVGWGAPEISLGALKVYENE